MGALERNLRYRGMRLRLKYDATAGVWFVYIRRRRLMPSDVGAAGKTAGEALARAAGRIDALLDSEPVPLPHAGRGVCPGAHLAPNPNPDTHLPGASQ